MPHTFKSQTNCRCSCSSVLTEVIMNEACIVLTEEMTSMTESGISSIKAAVSVPELLCVQRSGNRFCSPGCQQSCSGVSAAGEWYWSVWLTLPSSTKFVFSSFTNHRTFSLSETLLTSSSHVYSDPGAKPYFEVSLPSPQGSEPSKPLTVSDRIFITKVLQGVQDEKGRGCWSSQLPALVLIMSKCCCHKAKTPSPQVVISIHFPTHFN